MPRTTDDTTIPRRGFLALLGGSLAAGGALIAGTVRQAEATTVPTLLLPASAEPLPALPAIPGHGLFAAHKSEFHAVIHVKRMLPDSEFRGWLEQGLRRARFFDGRDMATMERLAEAAVSKHGSVIAAMRAGAFRAGRVA